MKTLLVVFSLVLSVVLFPASALAHGMWTEYQVDNAVLELTAVFSTGDRFEGAKVEIYAPNNPDQPWMEGVTDAEGNFAFTPDTGLEGDWKIRIGEGDHGDILQVPVTEAGVDEQLISQAPYDAPHRWMKQMTVASLAFGSGVGSALYGRRWFRF
ncbi:carboxypeptidase regulatory-like domain-containing protein [Leptolyngbya sp. AN02str]|uniref:carboxypeptidase regulatory-like domain-containing protein n=1 Tax=Leptolyngbya sp. AN02str TaxID=3423363 RepID=UPI003D31974A